MAEKPSVLFVCVHNAGRSQMAAGYLIHLSKGAIEVRSAGSEPADKINPVAVEYSGAVRSPGSLVRAELVAARPGTRTAVRVTRQADHLLATADWNGGPVARRATRLEPFDEMPYLAEALDRTGHDRIFDLALAKAIALMGEVADD